MAEPSSETNLRGIGILRSDLIERISYGLSADSDQHYSEEQPGGRTDMRSLATPRIRTTAGPPTPEQYSPLENEEWESDT
ncbi:hypothetical protein BLNAU_22858 [Blattamonas nauphoetae]|uniref:Uncharacterized protein n=1 Tax=Blattamonas nauphoetae TaxID=2049346 RepID=A0ABQ9WSB8_9EUKA|nr:hypothetical protein BLNAU_22858 [Blattamonas nauphoetae]